MTGRWKRRMERLASANRDARDRELRSLSVERAARVLEGLLAHPIAAPSRRAHHPVSLSHRMRRRHV